MLLQAQTERKQRRKWLGRLIDLPKLDLSLRKRVEFRMADMVAGHAKLKERQGKWLKT